MHYYILIDQKIADFSNTWRSMERFMDCLRALSCRNNVDVIDLDPSRVNKTILDLKNTLGSSGKNDSEICLIYAGYRFPLFKLTRAKWLRSGNYRHLIIPFGGLLQNPHTALATFLPLSDSLVSFMGSSPTNVAQIKRLLNTDSIFDHPYPFSLESKIISEEKNFNTPGTRKFCYGGRLTSSKGLEEIISAYAKVSKLYPDSELHIAGFESTQAYNLQGEVNQFNPKKLGAIEKIVFHSDLDENDWKQLLKEMDVFIYPSTAYEEDFALSLVEAKQSGLPVIVTRWSVLKDLVGNSDWLLPVGLKGNKYGFEVADLVAAMVEAQKSPTLKKSSLPDSFYFDDWWDELKTKLDKMIFTPFEFKQEYFEYWKLFLESGHAPFEELEGKSKELHHYFTEELIK